MATPLASLLPNGEQQFCDANGVPYAGGHVYMYVPNTTTFKTTWLDPQEAVANTNPVVLDGAGRAIIYGSGQYTQVLKDSLGNTVWTQLTQDFISIITPAVVNVVKQFTSVAALEANTSTGLTQVTLQGYYGNGTALDSYGGGLFWYNAGDTTSAGDGFSIFVDSVAQRWYRSFFGAKINPHMAGAYGDGAHNDSTSIQTVINWLAGEGGGAVWHPALGATYLANVILATGVVLTSDMFGQGDLDFPVSPATYKGASTTAWVVDTPSGATEVCGVEGINFEGAVGATGGGGVRFQNVSRGFIRDVHFDQFLDQGFLISAGEACTFDGILADNCLLNRTRGTYNGAIEIHGTDHYLGRFEGTPSLGSSVTGAGFCCGVAIYAATCFSGDGIVGEFADIGVFIGGNLNRLANVRGDTNGGYGLVFGNTAGSNQISDYTSYNNSLSGTNSFDGVLDNGQGNKILGITAQQSSSSTLLRYVVNSPTGYAAISSRGQYGPITQSCATGGNAYAGALVNFDGTSHQGSALLETSLPLVTGNATPDVTGTDFVVLNSAAITNFIGGWDGKTLSVLPNSGTNTIANNSTIQTNTGATKALVNGLVYKFKFFNAVWHEEAP